MSRVTLRSAAVPDLPLILRGERHYLAEIEPDHLDGWLAAIDRNLETWIDNLDRTRIAVIDRTPVGYAMWDVRDTVATLLTIYALPEHRGAGIGTALLRAFIDEATAAGAAVLELGVHVDNGARVLYERAGFTHVGRDGDYLRYSLRAEEVTEHAPVDLHLHDRGFADLDAGTLYAVLRLRTDVFVVEQSCPYPELDGRDLEPGTRHLWLAPVDEPTDPRSYLRILTEPDGAARIGRVCTAAGHRGAGLSGRLIAAALARIDDRPCVLDAQSHLVDFYAAFGFTAAGPEFVEDGIPHVPMRR